jgi:hypothetical protein
MKRIIAMILACALALTACGQAASNSVASSEAATESTAAETTVIESSTEENNAEESEIATESEAEVETEQVQVGELPSIDYKEIDTEHLNMDDPDLLQYVEDNVYSDLVDQLDDEEYFVENVSAVYVSQEYLDEVAFNSQSNVFFGYSLPELDAEFEGTRYVFTLGDDGSTIVQAFEDYDDTYEKVIKNVAIGTGVILVCVTVSVATAGAGAPAVSMIFAMAAKSGTTLALSSGTISFAAASIITGIQSGNPEEALKTGALAGSDSFKWGAISGAITGGGTEALALKGATMNGLTMNEAALIQKESKWPLGAIKGLHSTAEYNIYKKASLIPTQLADGSWAFLRKIDWDMVDDFGRTNVQRVTAGLAPIDSTGMPYELHHIGMRADSPLAILTNAEHHSKENYSILHWAEEGKKITDAEWSAQKKIFWKAILKMAQGA